jgi:hypothetical protein
MSVLHDKGERNCWAKKGLTTARADPVRRRKGIGRGGHGAASTIDYLGPEPLRIIQMLCVFEKIAGAFAEGFTSLRQIGTHLKAMSFRGEYRNRLPYGKRSLSQCCTDAEIYFGRGFELGAKAELFVRAGAVESVIDLTDTGVAAWALTRDFLVAYGVIRKDQ